MVNKSREVGSVVKIDSLLLRKVEGFVKKEENKLRFVNKKQFIDNAVFEFLQKNKENKERRKNNNEK